LGNHTIITDPLGRKTTNVINDYYLPTETIYHNGEKTSIEYLYTNNLQEAKDYPTKIVELGGKIRNYGYDSSGNLISSTDLAGQAYTYSYDNNGIAALTSPTGAKISYEYDSEGNLLELSYGNQLSKQYSYEPDGKLQTITNASGSTITNTYNAQGQISSQTATNIDGSTNTLSMTYNADGNLSTLTNSTGTTRYQYDSDGNISQLSAANGSMISYFRDSQGRIITQTEQVNANAIGLTTKYSYDLLGNLLTVTDSQNRLTTMTYDGVNRLSTKTLPNGVKATYSYDDLDRITSIVYTQADGNVLASETYTRYVGGEPSQVLREDGSYTLYEYDGALRLSEERSYNSAGLAIRSISYTYDLDGKRTRKVDNLATQNYTYNANTQLATAGENQYTYDLDGRLNQFTKDGQTVNLAHNNYERLTQVEFNGTTTNYFYNAQGNRIGEVSGNGLKNYLVATNESNGLASIDLVADGNGNVLSDYIYGGNRLLARLDALGNPIYYLTDSMGSVIGLVDGDGNLVSRIIYDGFGHVLSGDDGSSLGGDFRFHGQWLESESGLYYMRARDYDPTTALFLSRDVAGVIDTEPESFHPYQFAYNNPLIYSDPTGNITISELKISQIIDDIFNTLKSQAINRTQSYLIDKARGLVGQALSSWMQQIIPTEAIYITKIAQLIGEAKDAGNPLEKLAMDNICPILESMGLKEWVWREPAILAVNGKPVSNGYLCGEPPISTSKFPKGLQPGSAAKPDFVISKYSPEETRNTKLSPLKAWLTGDFKISVSKAADYIQANTTQWKSMSAFASSRQFLPLTMFVTFFNAQSESEIKLLQKKAFDTKKVTLFILPLTNIKGKKIRL
jgi:RHS repeat-associated protein